MSESVEVHEAVRDGDGVLIYRLLVPPFSMIYVEPSLPYGYAPREPYHWRSYCTVAKPKEKDDRIPFAMRPHSVFCGECGGWEPPAVEAIAEYEWFLKCGSCDRIITTMRGSLEEA